MLVDGKGEPVFVGSIFEYEGHKEELHRHNAVVLEIVNSHSVRVCWSHEKNPDHNQYRVDSFVNAGWRIVAIKQDFI